MQSTFCVNGWQRIGIVLSVVWALVGSLWASPSVAQTSKEYALRGQKAYSAFRCAALASFAGNEDEHHRLFQLGYEEGKTFIEALRNEKIDAADVTSTVPTGIVVDIDGPTADFSLGRVWESVVADLLDRVGKKSDGSYLSNDQLAVAAKDHFSRENCRFVGPVPVR